MGKEGRGGWGGGVLNTVLYLEAPPRCPTPYVTLNKKGASFKYVVYNFAWRENNNNNYNNNIHLYSAFLVVIQSALQSVNTKFKYIITGFYNPKWQEATSWLFTRVAEDLSSGRPRTNPASGSSGTRARDRRIASPKRWPLGHTASCTGFKLWINHKGRKISRLFHSHKILPLALLDPLTDRNDRFRYTIIYFN